jgi:hypothetical protein
MSRAEHLQPAKSCLRRDGYDVYNTILGWAELNNIIFLAGTKMRPDSDQATSASGNDKIGIATAVYSLRAAPPIAAGWRHLGLSRRIKPTARIARLIGTSERELSRSRVIRITAP